MKLGTVYNMRMSMFQLKVYSFEMNIKSYSVIIYTDDY